MSDVIDFDKERRKLGKQGFEQFQEKHIDNGVVVGIKKNTSSKGPENTDWYTERMGLTEDRDVDRIVKKKIDVEERAKALHKEYRSKYPHDMWHHYECHVCHRAPSCSFTELVDNWSLHFSRFCKTCCSKVGLEWKRGI